jgi:hypothetical protein
VLPTSALKILTAFREARQWQHTGEVVLRSGDATGHIFFAGGKIAWATASNLKRTFTDYMVEEAKLEAEALKQVFEECKRTGQNFGETIIEWGLLDEPSLRKFLLEQISATVLEVFTWTTLDSMFVPGRRTYKGSLTFDVPEVLANVLDADGEGRLPFKVANANALLEEGERAAAQVVQPEAAKKRPLKALVAVAVVAALAAGATAAVLLRRPTNAQHALAPRDASTQSAQVPSALAVAARGDARGGAAPDAGLALAGGAASEAGDAGALADADADEGPRVFPTDAIVAYADGEGLGSIRVKSTPAKAAIFLDGVSTGLVTPAVLGRVAAGRDHTVLVDKDGQRFAFVRLTLNKGESAEVKLTLAKPKKAPAGRTVKVRVESEPPGASVVLDGSPFKQLTPVSIPVPVGKASMLVVIHDGYAPWVRNVRPAPEVPQTIFGRLKKQ